MFCKYIMSALRQTRNDLFEIPTYDTWKISQESLLMQPVPITLKRVKHTSNKNDDDVVLSHAIPARKPQIKAQPDEIKLRC